MKYYMFDLCVYGGNAGGIAAACTAAELGLSVCVVEQTNHPGGMSASGLGLTDQEDFTLLGGFAGRFYDAVKKHYEANDNPKSFHSRGKGKSHEPHVAEEIFQKVIKEKKIIFFPAHRLNCIDMSRKRIVAAYFDYAPPSFEGVPVSMPEEPNALKIIAKYFIDASYEGDLLAAAGVSFIIGRESKNAYKESLAGVRLTKPIGIDLYRNTGNPASGLIPLIQEYDGKQDGEAENTVQSYNFRLCMSKTNMIPIQPPENYDPFTYEIFGRMLSMWEENGVPLFPDQYHEKWIPNYVHPRMLKFSPIPNEKVDLNNSEGGTTDMVGYSGAYPAGDWKIRSALWRKHIDYTKGLFYFLRTDSRVRPETRKELAGWGLAADEFRDTANWPFQLYVRESRRMIGIHIMTASDCENNTVEHSVGLGSYPLDSHNCRRMGVNGQMVLEGSFWCIPERPYYRIAMESLLPKKQECENLAVPVCMSASHVAYSSLRMEPVMMILAESAAALIALAASRNSAVQDVSYERLRKILLDRGQIL